MRTGPSAITESADSGARRSCAIARCTSYRQPYCRAGTRSMPEQEFLGVDQHPAQVFDRLALVLGRGEVLGRPRPSSDALGSRESATR